MKNKLFNINAWFLLLVLAVKPVSLFAMDDKDKGFGSGFKKGFLSSAKKEKEIPPVISREPLINATAVISAPPAVEGKSTRECYSIWLDQTYSNAEAISSIFQRVNMVCPPTLVHERMYPWFKKRQIHEEMKVVQENFKLLYLALSTEDSVEIGKIAKAWKCGNSKSAVRKATLMNIDLLGSYFLIKALSNEKKRNQEYSHWCPTESAAFYEDVLRMYDIPAGQRFIDHKKPMIAMQIVDNLLLFSMFAYTLPIEDGFLTSGSDENQGQLIVCARFWPMDLPKPYIFYYRENVNGLLLYRMYFGSTPATSKVVYDTARYLPEASDFKGYQFTQIHAQTESLDISDLKSGYNVRTCNSGYILNKDGTLFQDEGIAVFMRDGLIEAFNYRLHSMIGQHCFTSVPYRQHTKETFHQSPYLEALVTLAGGVERVEREELVFIPQQVTRTAEQPAYEVASFLLPYLYELREIDGENEPLVRTILRIENILADAEYEEKSADAMIEVEQDIAQQIEKEIELGAPEILAAIDNKATQLCAAYKRPERKKKWGVESKNARDRATLQLKEEQKTARLNGLSEGDKARLKKEKILEKIRASFIAKTTDRRHFDSSEVADILASMRRSFARAGVESTGAATTRGSHTGIEVSAAGGSVKLGLAKRPQTHGYESGTVRTIINDHVDRILSLVINS